MTEIAQKGISGAPKPKTPANLLGPDPIWPRFQACLPDSWGSRDSYDESKGAAWR